MEKRHKGLHALSVVFTVVAWVAVVIGVIGAVGILVGGGAPDTPRAVSLAVLGIGALYFCLFNALSGILRLLLVIEEQTRKPA